MKKDSFVKDALVLTLITLIAGVLLGATYGATKVKIEETNRAATMKAYAAVVKADKYDEDSGKELLAKAVTDGTIAADNGGCELLSVAYAEDASDKIVGYIVTAQTNGYGGYDKVVVGIGADLKVTGISYPEALPETPGLGQKATQESFYGQFAGKGSKLKVVKSGQGSGADDEIDAISGATITSKAVTNTVNGATEFVENYVLKEAK